MPYFVNFAGFGVGEQPTVEAMDDGLTRPWELPDALAHACRLIDEGKRGVAIRDNDGHSISGAELVACCKGDKEITPDLQAIEPASE
jgi:hypothetical protein